MLKNISEYYCFYCIFDQINAALVSIKGSKTLTNLPNPELNSSLCTTYTYTCTFIYYLEIFHIYIHEILQVDH